MTFDDKSQVEIELKSLVNPDNYVIRFQDNSAIISLNGNLTFIEASAEYKVYCDQPAPVFPLHSGHNS